jgi:hypothetical protein
VYNRITLIKFDESYWYGIPAMVEPIRKLLKNIGIFEWKLNGILKIGKWGRKESYSFA